MSLTEKVISSIIFIAAGYLMTIMTNRGLDDMRRKTMKINPELVEKERWVLSDDKKEFFKWAYIFGVAYLLVLIWFFEMLPHKN